MYLGDQHTMILLLLACTASEKDTSVSNEPTVSVSGRVVELFGGIGVERVDVCLKDSSLCAQTDSDGRYDLDVPTQAEHILLLNGTDLVGGTVAFTAQEDSIELANVSLLSPAIVEGQFSALDQTWEPNTGALAFSISNGVNGDGINVPNISVAIEPSSGDGPFYSSALGLPVDDLTATSDNGGGVMINLPEDIYQLNYGNLPEDCSLLLGWGSALEHQIPIVADRVSFARVTCPE